MNITSPKLCSSFLCAALLILPSTVWSKSGLAKEPAIARTAIDKEINWGPAPAFMPAGTELAVLHGDPTKNNADVLIRFPAKASIPNHFHSSAERMVLISGQLKVTFEGQESLVMKPGTYSYGPAKLKHEGSCESNEPCVLFIAFEGPVDAIPVAKK